MADHYKGQTKENGYRKRQGRGRGTGRQQNRSADDPTHDGNGNSGIPVSRFEDSSESGSKEKGHPSYRATAEEGG
jgi:hypothetical protein